MCIRDRLITGAFGHELDPFHGPECVGLHFQQLPVYVAEFYLRTERNKIHDVGLIITVGDVTVFQEETLLII